MLKQLNLVKNCLKKYRLNYSKPSNLISQTAKYLHDSKIIGWFQGRMEIGARALGNRSILASPLDPNIRDIVNKKVKFREPWRPFCPSTIDKFGVNYFDYDKPMPYMIVACNAKKNMKETLPSVVHTDNTVRVQSVDCNINPKFYELIQAVGKLSGYYVVLNTSFNVKGEPIVCDPEDAIKCFLKTGIDVLVIGDYVVTEKCPI